MKRLTALLLALCMLTSCLPAALAEETFVPQPEEAEPALPEEAFSADEALGLPEEEAFAEDFSFDSFFEEEPGEPEVFLFDEPAESKEELFEELPAENAALDGLILEEEAPGEEGPEPSDGAPEGELPSEEPAEEATDEPAEPEDEAETGNLAAAPEGRATEAQEEPDPADEEQEEPERAGLAGVSLSSLPAYALSEEAKGAKVKSQGTKNVSAVVGEIVVLQATFSKAIKSGKWQYTANGGKTWKTFKGGVTESDGSKVRLLGFVAEKKHFKYGFRYLAKFKNGTKGQTNTIKLKDRLSRKSKAKTAVSVTMNGTAKFTLQAKYAAGFQWQFSTNKGKTWKNVSGSAYSVQKVPDEIQFDYEGENPSFAVSSSGGSSTLSFTVTSGEFKRVYRCKAIGTSGAAKYGYYWIVKQPTAPTVRHLSTAKLSFKAAGARKYQWQYLSGSKWKNCSGKAAKKATYSFRMTRTMAKRTYRCRYYGYDKKWRASAKVKINAVIPTYRALLIGQNYNGNDYGIRKLPGSSNNLKGLKAVLAKDKETAYKVTAKSNQTKYGIKSAISAAYAGAQDKDVSLFYFCGHGYAGSGALCCYDNTAIYPSELHDLLAAVPGRKIVIIDTCFSGAMIGQSGLSARSADGTPEGFNDAFLDGFTAGSGLSSRAAASTLAESGFYVLTACSRTQESYQIGWPVNGKYRWGGWMSRYLMEGAGINFFSFGKTGLKADSNKNKTVTLNELFKYIRKKINTEKAQIGASQSTKIWPSGSGQPVFAR